MLDNMVIISLLQILTGGLICMISAGLAGHFGYRCADRLPGESRWPSCVYCFSPLTFIRITPLIGWLMHRGGAALACPCGRRTRLWHQPAVELAGLLLGIVATTGLTIESDGWTWMMLPLCMGLGILPAIILTDLSFGLIPDELNLALAVTGFLWLWLSGGDVYAGLLTAGGLLTLGLLLALGYSKLRGREMLGLGDVKFFTAAGFWLPMALVPWFLFLAGVLGGILGFAWRRAGGGREFPFAPALCVALAVLVLVDLF